MPNKKSPKRPSRRVSGAKFTELMQRYGLRSSRGAELVALYLHMQPSTIHQLYQDARGIQRTDYELLEIRLQQLQQRTVAMQFKSKVCPTPGGRWAWSLSENGVDFACGGGYESKEAATEAMRDALETHIIDTEIQRIKQHGDNL